MQPLHAVIPAVTMNSAIDSRVQVVLLPSANQSNGIVLIGSFIRMGVNIQQSITHSTDMYEKHY